jgi:hypothetical protein
VVRAAGREPATTEAALVGILWAVLVILLILWALGFFLANLGSIIHILLVIALVVLVYNLVVGRRAAL